MDDIIYELAKGRLYSLKINKYIERSCQSLLYLMRREPKKTICAANIMQKILNRTEEPHDCIDNPTATKIFIMDILTNTELEILVDAVTIFNDDVSRAGLTEGI